MDSDLEDTSEDNPESSSAARRKLADKLGKWADHPSWDPLPEESDAEICEKLLNLAVSGQASETNEDGDRKYELAQTPRFLVIQKIGEGAFGIVFKVYDNSLKRHVAVKVLKPSLGSEKKLIRRFIREAAAIAMMDCEHIIKVYDMGRVGKQPFIVMELIEGQNFRSWLAAQSKPCDISRAINWMYDIANAVSYAHDRGILHRDLKPSNILLKPLNSSSKSIHEVTPVLTDFGLAKQLDTHNLTAIDLTAETERVGTLRYMSPEQASGSNRDIATTSDVFSLGVIFYEILTQQLPFQGEENAAIIYQICHHAPTKPRLLRREIPRDLEAVILKCLEKEPASRYSSGSELLKDLKRLLQGMPVEASNPTLVRRFLAIVRNNPIPALAYSLAVICFLVFFFLWIALLAKERSQYARAENNLKLALYGISQSISDYALRINDGIPITHEQNLKVLLTSLEVHRKLSEQNPTDTIALHRLAVAHHFAANGFARVNNHEQAVYHRRAFRDITEDLLFREPANTQFLYDGFMANNLLTIELPVADTTDRAAALERAETLIKKVLSKHPQEIEYANAYNDLRLKKVSLSRNINDHEEELIDISNSSLNLYRENRQNPLLAKPAIQAHLQLGSVKLEERNLSESLKRFEEADRLIMEIFPETKRDALIWHLGMTAKFHQAYIHFAQQRWDKADQEAAEAFRYWDYYNKYQPTYTDYLPEILLLRYGSNRMLGKKEDADALEGYVQQAAKQLNAEEKVAPFKLWIETMVTDGPQAAEKCLPF